MAARHLIDDIVNGNIQIIGNANYVKENAKKLEELIITFHKSPKENLQEILEILFDTTSGRRIPLV
jgi:predicted transcriptional regulator